MNVTSLLARIGFKVDDKPLDHVRDRLEGIEHKLSMIGAVELVRGIVEMSEKFSGFAAHLSNTAAATGMSVEGLQGLQFAASQSGSSAEAVGSSMDKLTKLLHAAREGSEEASEAFASVGISGAQVASFRTSADALGAVADRMRGLHDPVQKQAIAMKLLGGAGAEMVPFLSQGSAAMREAAEEAVNMGAILSGDNVRALQEVEDSLSELWQVVKVFSATVASYFAPGVKSAVHALLDLWKANQQLIKTTLKGWAEDLMYAMGWVFGIVEGLTTKFLDFAKAHPVLARMAGMLVLGLMGVAASAWAINKGVGMASSALGIFQSVLKGVGAVISFISSPVGLIIAGLAALVLVLQAAYQMLFNKAAFKDTWLGQLWDTAKGAMAKGLDWLIGDKFRAQAAATVVSEGPPAGPLATLSNLPAGSVPAGATASMLGGPVTAPPGDQNNYVTAPITINVPAGTAPGDVAGAVQDGVREHLDRLSRETQRATRTAQVY